MITTTDHPVFALLPEMSREDVIAHLTPIATEPPSWDAKRNRLIASIPDLGPFPRIEMTFAPGLRAVFFRAGWQCTFDRLLERVDELEEWFGDPALTGLRAKVEGARSKIERKGSAKTSMSVMFVMTDLPGGGYVSFSSGGFDAGGSEGYLIEVTWRPPARIDRGGLDELYMRA